MTRYFHLNTKDLVDREFISYNIKSNIRELEGALISLVAQSSLNRREIDLTLAKDVIKNFVSEISKEITIEYIIKLVADHYELDVGRIQGKTRKRSVVIARQLSMYLAKNLTNKSLKAIGENFGGRDHSTVIYSCQAVQNMLDNIDSSSDVFPTTDFVASTEPEGDNNAAIYLTKKITLENPATAIKVLLSAHRPSTSEIQVMFKTLRTDDATEFDDLGYTYFKTTGVDDNDTPASADVDDFQEYIYTAGVTDDGIGDPLDEFISFQIKIVMQGTNSAEPPRIKELRAIALVT